MELSLSRSPALWLQLLTLVPLLYALGLMANIDWAQVFGNAVLWLRPLPWGYRSLNGVYWTLVVEFSFYLLLPWLLMLLRCTHILLLLASVSYHAVERPLSAGFPASAHL